MPTNSISDGFIHPSLIGVTWFTTPEFRALRFLLLPLFDVLLPFKECLNLFVVVKISHRELRLNDLSIRQIRSVWGFPVSLPALSYELPLYGGFRLECDSSVTDVAALYLK